MNDNLLNDNRRELGSMSLLPILIIVGLILGAGYFLLRGEVKIPGFEKSNRIETRRLEGFPVSVPVTEEKEKQRVVIKSEQELAQFLENVDDAGSIAFNNPVDFDREYLLASSTETLSTGGYDYEIDKVRIDEDDGSLTVVTELKMPGDTCVVTQQQNVLVDIVAIEKIDQEIEFEIVKSTQECE